MQSVRSVFIAWLYAGPQCFAVNLTVSDVSVLRYTKVNVNNCGFIAICYTKNNEVRFNVTECKK
jgi:hypothetical protein